MSAPQVTYRACKAFTGRALPVYPGPMTLITESAALAQFCARQAKAEFLTVDAGHFAYVPIGNWLGRLVMRDLFVDPKGSVDRAEIHARIKARAPDFFQASFRAQSARSPAPSLCLGQDEGVK